MHFSTAASFAAVAFSGMAAAAATPAVAHITIEASHGGAGSDLTNKTVKVEVGKVFTSKYLDEVSTLYLTDVTGTNDVNAYLCQPYTDAKATKKGGLLFNVGHPSLLSTNTVKVGSIKCFDESTLSCL